MSEAPRAVICAALDSPLRFADPVEQTVNDRSLLPVGYRQHAKET
jgi:hypothetical protein